MRSSSLYVSRSLWCVLMSLNFTTCPSAWPDYVNRSTNRNMTGCKAAVMIGSCNGWNWHERPIKFGVFGRRAGFVLNLKLASLVFFRGSGPSKHCRQHSTRSIRSSSETYRKKRTAASLVLFLNHVDIRRNYVGRINSHNACNNAGRADFIPGGLEESHGIAPSKYLGRRWRYVKCGWYRINGVISCKTTSNSR